MLKIYVVSFVWSVSNCVHQLPSLDRYLELWYLYVSSSPDGLVS